LIKGGAVAKPTAAHSADMTTYGYDALSHLLCVSNPDIQSNPLLQRT
jgi:YD repeat-containing protein